LTIIGGALTGKSAASAGAVRATRPAAAITVLHRPSPKNFFLDILKPNTIPTKAVSPGCNSLPQTRKPDNRYTVSKVRCGSIATGRLPLRSIRANTIREVRGRGLMLAVELHPEAGRARRYCEALQSRGILAKDTHEHIIRVAPPLVITSDQVDWALDRFGATLSQDFS
jgi:hypothetical protein